MNKTITKPKAKPSNKPISKAMGSKSKLKAQPVYYHTLTNCFYRDKPLLPESELIRFDSILECKTYMAILRWGKAEKVDMQSPARLLPAQGSYGILNWKIDFKIYLPDIATPIFIESKGVSTKDFLIKLRLFKHFYPGYPIIFVTHKARRIDPQHNSVTLSTLPKLLDILASNPTRAVEVAGMQLEVS